MRCSLQVCRHFATNIWQNCKASGANLRAILIDRGWASRGPDLFAAKVREKRQMKTGGCLDLRRVA